MPVTKNPLKLKFYDSAMDSFMKFAVIISRYQNKWVFCTHKDRNTYEIPGGKREIGESILETAKRELYEETGATKFTIVPITPYSVIELDKESFGMLYYAEIQELGELPNSEIDSVILFDTLPTMDAWTYPTLQPLMIDKFLKTRGKTHD